MSKTVSFTTSQKIDCGSCKPCNSCPSVILCLASDALIAQVDCPGSEGESDFGYSYITGQLVYSNRTITSCGNATYTYGVSYDENLLADPTTPLVATDITGIFCTDCRTQWIEDLLGNEPYIRTNDNGTQDFISPHGCVYPLAAVAPSFSIPPDGGITFETLGTSFRINTSHGTFNGQRDDVLSFGYNVAFGTYVVPPAKIDPAEPAYAFKMESHYVEGMTLNHLCEVNFDYISANDLFSERPFYWSANRITNETYMLHQADIIDMLTPIWRNRSKTTGATTYLTCTLGILECNGLCAGIGLTPLAAYGTPAIRSQGAIYQQNANCNIFFDAYAGAADNRVWAMRANSAGLYFDMGVMDDAGTLITEFLKVIRSGTTVTSVAIPNGIAVHANNAAAIGAGLVAGALYRTGADPDVVCIVH